MNLRKNLDTTNFFRYEKLFVAGRLEQDGPYEGPGWGFFRHL